MNAFFFKALNIKAKNGSDNKYLPTKNKTIIASIDVTIVENLKNEEKALDSILAINHKKPYTVKKITIPNNNKFINEEYHTQTAQGNKSHKNSYPRINRWLRLGSSKIIGRKFCKNRSFKSRST